MAAVLFTREGITYASPVFRMPLDMLTEGFYEAQRIATISNAKQIGLGILQLTFDSEENLPAPGSAVADAILPYVKTWSVFNNPVLGKPGFVYTYKGERPMASVALVASTEMGYVSGVGGKAIIWVDGHVTWEDDK